MAKKAPYIIFLVEDDLVYCKSLELYLKEHLKLNAEIYAYPNGEECLKNMNMNPSIIVLDYYLNNQNATAQNGLEVLKKVKRTHHETEVIMLSAQDKIQVALDSMTHGAFNYLTKNEVSFLRLQGTIYNITRVFKLRSDLKAAKRGKVVVFIVLVLVAAIAWFINHLYPYA